MSLSAQDYARSPPSNIAAIDLKVKIPKSNAFSPSYTSTATLCGAGAFWKRLLVGMFLTIIVFWATGQEGSFGRRIAED